MTTNRRRVVVLLALSAVCSSLVAVGGSAHAQATCAPGAAGGDWPSYGRNLRNSRHQELEGTIGPANAGSLTPAWTFSSVGAGGSGGFQSTPVIAGGCVYLGSSGGGWIFAVNADTGELVWKRQIQQSDVGGRPGGMYALSVADGRVHANLSVGSREGDIVSAPVAIALDAATGGLLWVSEPIHFNYRTSATASAVVANGMHLLATSGPDADDEARPGIALIDAATGATLTKNTVIPVADLDRDFAGGGIWATAVVDTSTGFAYAGTANPYASCCEHEYDNAIVKVDVNQGSATFGRVVDAYKGNVDQYFPGLDRQPACEQFPEIDYIFGFSATCLQLDVDFGASPLIFENSRGRTLVGSLQKSGIFHAALADTMQLAWTALVSYPAALGNSATSATDGNAIYVLGNPGLLYSLRPDNGRINWIAPVADGAEYHSVSVANDVVYVIGNHGLLMGFDANLGIPVLARPLPADAADACASLGGGVAVARNKVYATCDTGATGGGWVIAYALS